MPKAVRRTPIPGRTRRTPPRTAGSGGSLMRRAASSASPRCSATAPPEASSNHDYANLPAVCGRGGRSPPPVHQTETVVLARHDKRSAVRANQPVVRPASPPAPQVVPAEPLMLPGRLRILGQRLKHGYVALADKPQFQLIAHESDRDTCEGSPPGASSCRAVDPGTDTNIEGRSRDPPGC